MSGLLGHWWLVLVDALAWVVISVVWGVVGAALSVRTLGRDSWWTRPRGWEDGGRFYRRLAVQRWKDALPESNRLGPGERLSKRALPSRQRMADLVAETRRAEYVHLAIAATGPAFFLWNPPWLGVVMVFAGCGFNLPFIIVQRYNRIRLLRVIDRARRSVS